jgi:hypothetical protein
MIASERYIAFLLSTLPKLAARPLYSRRWPFPMRRRAVLAAALRRLAGRPGIGLEFGVYRGASLRLAAQSSPERTFYGFDSFAGLPEDGRPDWKMDFAVRAPPTLPGNCRLVAGWFRDTIPEFLRAHSEPIAFVNIDCDIYSSSRDVLFGLGDRLRPGAVLYFDELLNYDSFLWNEMLALFEFLEATGYGVEWVGAHCRVREAAEALARLSAGTYPAWRADVAAGYQRPAAAILTARNEDLALSQSPQAAQQIAALAAQFDACTARYRALRPPG